MGIGVHGETGASVVKHVVQENIPEQDSAIILLLKMVAKAAKGLEVKKKNASSNLATQVCKMFSSFDSECTEKSHFHFKPDVSLVPYNVSQSSESCGCEVDSPVNVSFDVWN